MKKGYWVVRAKLIDNEEYSKYINLATEIIKKYGGQFIVRGGHQKEFENFGFERTVVVEFESYDDAVKCYKSSDYQSALDHVKDSAVRYVSIVEGF